MVKTLDSRVENFTSMELSIAKHNFMVRSEYAGIIISYLLTYCTYKVYKTMNI